MTDKKRKAAIDKRWRKYIQDRDEMNELHNTQRDALWFEYKADVAKLENTQDGDVSVNKGATAQCA